MPKPTILIAVNSAAGAGGLEEWAGKEGFRVIGRVSTGNEAVALAESQHPLVVILDSQPGGTLGLDEILMRIQSENGIPVVLVAASDDDLPAHETRHGRPCGYLVRPFGPRLFGQVVRSAIRQHTSSHGGKKPYPLPMVRKVAHDINNSLSSALANIQLARRSVALEKHVDRHLDNAEKSILQARDHSHQLLVPFGNQETGTSAVQQAPVSAPHRRSPAATRKKAPTSYRILLMDDEAAILSATSDLLSFLGHTVTVAKSGEESVELYRKARAGGRQFDVVILDITVPGGLGAGETLPRLREIDPEVRAIISSGYANHPLLVNFAASGFVASLIKPYGFKELEEALAQVPLPK